MKITADVYQALKVLILARVNEIDDTECNNQQVSGQMKEERALLLQGLGELMAVR